jgi:TPR repeat protein
MSRALPIVVALAASVAAAVPGKAADTWVEVKSPGFTVICDGSEKDARQVAWQFEQIRALFKRIWPWAQLDMPRPVVIVTVRNEAGLKALGPEYWEEKGRWRPAGFWANGREAYYVASRRDIAGFRAADDKWDNPYLIPYRQYVHLVLERNFDRLPFWFAQGLAEFWGNTIIDGKYVYEGRAVPSHLRVLRERALLPFDALFAVTRNSPEFKQEGRSDVFFAQTWALTHYLMMADARAGQMNTFLKLVVEGKSDADAAKAAFGDLGALAKELDKYARQVAYRYRRQEVALDVDDKAYRSRPLSPGESMGLRALFHVAMRRPAEAQALIDAALKLEPELALAHEAAAYLAYNQERREEARERLARVLKSPAASFYAHYLWAYLENTAHPDPGGWERAEAALKKAVELNPNFADAYTDLSWVMSKRNAPIDTTLPLARRAVSLEPTEADHRINAGWLLVSANRLAEGKVEAQRALALAGDDKDRGRAQELLAAASTPQSAGPAHARIGPEQACEAGQGSACLVAGIVLRDGTNGTTDPARAAQFFEKACGAGELDGCVALGLALERGEGVAKDPKRSVEVLSRACDGGLPQGCSELGYLHLGRGTVQGRKQAAALLRRACEGGDAPACNALATLYETGLGVVKSLTQARNLYAQACAAGYQPACPKAPTPRK